MLLRSEYFYLFSHFPLRRPFAFHVFILSLFRALVNWFLDLALSIQILSRGKGRSAVAAAAYRTGETIKNEYDGVTHDYTKKSDIVHTEIFLPEHVPPEYADRAVLWNAVEHIEKSKNSQLAREIEIALPKELSAEKNIALVSEYIKNTFVEQGMCADLAIHDKDGGNPHAHIMLTIRPFNEDGTWGAKSKKEYILDENGERIKLKSGEYKSRKINAVDWNEQTKAEEWRNGWADCVNKFLESENVAERVDHRSYERQGVEQIPTVHLGVAAFQMERRGIRTRRGDTNRNINNMNQQIRQTRARIKKVKNWLYSQPLTNAPTMISVMNNISAGKNLNTHWKRINDLKLRAKILIFLQHNEIYTVEKLVGKIEKINNEFYDVSKKIKSAERRLDTLNNHLAHYDNYKQYKAVYEKYKALAPKKRDAFYEKHSNEIQFYRDAKSYLDEIMNGNKTIPIKEWQAEQKKLTFDKYMLCENFYRLKDEVHYVEVLQKSTENLIQESEQEQTKTKNKGVEL